MTAINEEFALEDDVITKEDVIAFIPPVSGG
jgi:molybdopterin synthase sulfur carrier subunit